MGLKITIELPDDMDVQDVRYLFADAFGEFISPRDPPEQYVAARYSEMGQAFKDRKLENVRKRLVWAKAIKHQGISYDG